MDDKRQNADKWLFDKPLDDEKLARAVILDRMIDGRYFWRRVGKTLLSWATPASLVFGLILGGYQAWQLLGL